MRYKDYMILVVGVLYSYTTAGKDQGLLWLLERFDPNSAKFAAAHQDQQRRVEEQHTRDRLRVAQFQFLIDSGWTDRGNGWWMPPSHLYHAVNSMLWVLRNKRGVV